MELINKIQIVALSSTAIAGGSALYSYNNSLDKEEEAIEEIKLEAPKEKPKAVKRGYDGCLESANFKPDSNKRKICGWIYGGGLKRSSHG